MNCWKAGPEERTTPRAGHHPRVIGWTGPANACPAACDSELTPSVSRKPAVRYSTENFMSSTGVVEESAKHPAI